jgi:hypothetical protein
VEVSTGFVVSGVIFGLLVGVVNEVFRRRRLAVRARFSREGVPATAVVEAVWPRGRNDNRREVHLSFADDDGREHLATVEVRAVEAGAIGLWEGAAIPIHYGRHDLGAVMIDRPAVTDDRGWVSLAAAAVVFVAFAAAATFV